MKLEPQSGEAHDGPSAPDEGRAGGEYATLIDVSVAIAEARRLSSPLDTFDRSDAADARVSQRVRECVGHRRLERKHRGMRNRRVLERCSHCLLPSG